MQGLVSLCSLVIEKLKSINWLGPLAFRLYLAPIFIGVGAHKFANFEDMVAWFGNPDWGLGLPMPTLMVFLAASAELFGGLALLVGVATRLFAIPLIFTMLVAMATSIGTTAGLPSLQVTLLQVLPASWPRWVFRRHSVA